MDMEITRINDITNLLKREIVPATGCTEPAAVALAVAYASSLSRCKAKMITVYLSANMIKNAMGVGIPGTGMIGIPIAIALGWTIAKPEKELDILNDFSKEEFEDAKKIISDNIINIELKKGDDIDKLHIEVVAEDENGHTVCATISKVHTRLVYLSCDGEKRDLANNVSISDTADPMACDDFDLCFGDLYHYVMTVDLDEVEFIYDAALKNKEASLYALNRKMGHDLGRIIRSDMGRDLMGDNAMTNMLAVTSLACDARMDGAPVSIVSNSGSGNQGITATLPVLSFAESKGVSKDVTIRALVMSSLVVIYAKRKVGRLSALCGMLYSGLGAAAAITYIMGGGKKEVADAITNMIGSVTGMICDGAKPSCTLKASAAISTSVLSAMLALNGEVLSNSEGIVDEDVDVSVANIARLSKYGMCDTDCAILDIMTSKNKRCK